jgi:hypothetical protein
VLSAQLSQSCRINLDHGSNLGPVALQGQRINPP